MSSMPWFPFYVDDFLASPKVQRMSVEEVGVYVLLLCQQHQEGVVEWPCERIPNALTGHESSIEYVLSECFEEGRDGWYNLRLRAIHREQEEKSAKARRSAEARWNKASNANAMRTHSERNATRASNANQNQNQSQITTSAAVGDFLKRTGSDWRLDRGIADWAAEIEGEPKYAGADIPYEIRKCADWHVSRSKQPKAPDMSIRNWLERAAESAQQKNGTKKEIPGWDRV